MATLISVDRTRAYACGFPIEGAAGAIIVNTRRAQTPEAVTAALAEAEQGIAATLAGIARGGLVKDRSESTEAGAGPFTSGAYELRNADLVMLTYRDGRGWALADRAPNFGPHACAIVVDPDVPGWQSVCSLAGIADAMRALPALPVPA